MLYIYKKSIAKTQISKNSGTERVASVVMMGILVRKLISRLNVMLVVGHFKLSCITSFQNQ